MDQTQAFETGLSPFIAFRDRAACERARAIPRARLTEHANPDFRIAVVDDAGEFYRRFAEDLVGRIRAARDEGRQFVAILPVGPMPQYEIAAGLINDERLSLAHVHTFNMDEYADEHGVTAPPSWPGSFQRAMWERFFALVDPELRPPESQIHFPTGDTIGDYSARLEDLGGADVCYGGIGRSGHIAFWEPQLGAEYDGDLDAYRQAGARHRSFWLDGDLGGGVSWQRFIARLVAHGPVSEFVPGSLLQTARSDYTILGNVADDVEIHMS